MELWQPPATRPAGYPFNLNTRSPVSGGVMMSNTSNSHTAALHCVGLIQNRVKAQNCNSGFYKKKNETIPKNQVIARWMALIAANRTLSANLTWQLKDGACIAI